MYSCRFFPSGVVVLSAGADMQLKIWSAETGKCAANLVGHRAGNKLKCQITSYCHMTNIIWDKCWIYLSSVSNIFSLIGVTDTSIIERGRNIVSVSKDGTAKLWDVGNKTCLATIEELGGPVNGCSLGPVDSSVNLGLPDLPPSKYTCMRKFVRLI